jgi:peptidoglycan/LPS O-acetylase OafA/YrhL
MSHAGPAPEFSVPRRFYSLDALRGVAALSVVFWHWQHFFYHGSATDGFVAARQPLFGLLFLFYRRGLMAVDLFFCLSGFVFFWLYAAAIAERRVGAREFVVLRLSRLYPLHLVTLLAVALGQLAHRALTGAWCVYPCNDARHFALNLVFAPSWGFERGFSFNAPVWSVSVEVFLYAIFFLWCRALPVRYPLLLVVALAGFGFQLVAYEPLGRGVASFFLGGCAYLVYQSTVAGGGVRRANRWLPVVTLALWLVALAAVHGDWSRQELLARWLPTSWRGGPLELATGLLLLVWPRLVLFPLTILTLALRETERGTLGRRLRFLGDISYSGYLLQFPLQLLVLLVVARCQIDRAVFYSPLALAAFMGVLLAASLCSYRRFELPVQQAWRRAALPERYARGSEVAQASGR